MKLEDIVVATAKTMNVFSEVINKQGLWHLLELKEVVPVFSGINFNDLKTQLKTATEQDREALELVFKTTLNLVDKVAEQKIKDSVDCLEQAVDLVEEILFQYVTTKMQVELLIEKVKKVVSA